MGRRGRKGYAAGRSCTHHRPCPRNGQEGHRGTKARFPSRLSSAQRPWPSMLTRRSLRFPRPGQDRPRCRAVLATYIRPAWAWPAAAARALARSKRLWRKSSHTSPTEEERGAEGLAGGGGHKLAGTMGHAVPGSRHSRDPRLRHPKAASVIGASEISNAALNRLVDAWRSPRNPARTHSQKWGTGGPGRCRLRPATLPRGGVFSGSTSAPGGPNESHKLGRVESRRISTSRVCGAAAQGSQALRALALAAVAIETETVHIRFAAPMGIRQTGTTRPPRFQQSRKTDFRGAIPPAERLPPHPMVSRQLRRERRPALG